MFEKVVPTIIRGVLMFLLLFTFISSVKAQSTNEFVIPTLTVGGFTGNGQFNNPRSVFLDTSGNIFVVDAYNHRIQKFNSSGAFQMKFGSLGSRDGQFDTPWGIFVDTSGDIFVADTNNNRIQKFNSSGTFQMKFGSLGSGDGQFNSPRGIYLDASGNIFVADANHRIQKFNSAGEFLMKFGGLGTGDGLLNNPRGVFVDTSGYIYVADTNNNRIQKFNSAGAFQMKFGAVGSSDGLLSNPFAVYLDTSGNIFVADMKNNRIQKFSSTGVFQMKFGTSGSGDGQLNSPRGVFVDTSGYIYVGDNNNHRIQKFDSIGTFQMKFGSLSTQDGQLNRPFSSFVDTSGNIFIADTVNHRIQKFNSAGVFQMKIGSLGSGDGQFTNPAGVFVDSTGNIFVADTDNHRIQKFDSEGVFQMKFGTSGSTDGKLNTPNAIFVDSTGFIFVADTLNNRIQKFNSAGVYQMKFGGIGSADGKLNNPYGIFVDSTGFIFVADTNNNRIQKFNSAGDYQMKFGSSGSGDGQFSLPSGVFVDESGSIYVADANHRIQKFNSAGVYQTKFGSYGPGNVQFNTPGGVFVDTAGNIFVADAFNNSIQKLLTIKTSNDLSVSQGSSVGLGSNAEIVVHSSSNSNPIAIVNTDLASAFDWTSMTAQTDLATGKAFMHYPGGAGSIPGINGNSYTLYIPKLAGQTQVLICPDVSALDQIVDGCANGHTFTEGETYNMTFASGSNNVTVSSTGIEGTVYWKAVGVMGTGGLGKYEAGVLSGLTLTPSSSNVSATQEVVMSYTTGLAFVSGDKIQITWENAAGLVLANTCTTPTVNADGVGGNDGSATIVGGNIYEYEFTDSVLANADLSFCVNVRAYDTQGSYAVSFNDDNAQFGAALYYVGGDNNVFVTADVAPTLSFNIVDFTDTTDTNICAIGDVSTNTPANNNDLVDLDGECGYGLAIGTNAANGFTAYVRANGTMSSGTASIANVGDNATFTAGTEAYGYAGFEPATTGRDTVTGVIGSPIIMNGVFANANSSQVPVVNSVFMTFPGGVEYALGDGATDITKVIHGMTIGSGTPAGYYSQTVTYTVTANF